MKKLFYSLFVLMTLIVGASYVTADIGPVNRSCSFDVTGALQTGSCDKFYVRVENDETSATLSAGMPVILSYSDDNGYKVVSSATASDIPFCVMAESCAINKQCDCQTYGITTSFKFDDRVDRGSAAVATAGTQVYLSEYLAGYGQAEPSDLGVKDYPIGIVLDTTSASADMEVFIRLR